MTNPTPHGQVPETLETPSHDQLRAIARVARNSSGSASDDCGPLAYVLHGWRAAVTAMRATHVQKPAEIEHVASDVSGNGAADLRKALVIAEAALADIGDADREPGDDLAWCEARAAQALPEVRAALANALRTQQPAPAKVVYSTPEEMFEAILTPQPSHTAQADSQPAPVREHDLQDVRCECCGYMTHHREHMGCIRAARAPADGVLKDHQIAALVNELRDIAIQYHGTQQLRERIAHAVVPALKARAADSVLEDAARLEFEMQHSSAIAAARKQGANHD